MKKVSRFSVLLLAVVLCLALSVSAFASGFNAGLDVTRTDTQITVVVQDSQVLHDKVPTLSIPADEAFDGAMLFFDGVASVVTYSSGSVSFKVAKGGTYYIVIGVAPKESTPATCVESGKNVYVFDDVEYIETIAATDEHSYTDKASEKLASAATCTEAAAYYVQCDLCDAVSDTKTVAVGDAIGGGHSYTDKASEKLASEATCTEAATYYVQCDRCDTVSDTKTVVVGKENGHSYTDKASEKLASEATCTEAAAYYVQCDRCDAVSDTKTVVVGKENGHSYTDRASEKLASEATCTEAATYYVQCDHCDAVSGTKTVAVGEENGHDFSNADQETCANCSAINPNYKAPITIPAGSDEDTVDVLVTVSENNISLETSEKDIEEIIEKAEASEENVEVKLDLSAVEQAASVTIPMNLIEAVKDSEKLESLVIDLPTVSVALDAETLQTVADAGAARVELEVNDNVDVKSLTPEQQKTLEDRQKDAVIVDLNMKVGEEKVSNFGGTLTITISYEPPEDTDHKKLVIKHIAADGTTTYIRSKYDNGRLSFGVDHFSVFVTDICEIARYDDIDLNEWYHDAVDYVVTNELMIGTGEDTFAPGLVLNRASMAMILWRMEGMPAVEKTGHFADVAEDAWYADAIAWAAEADLIKGYTDGLCHPGDALTREQMVTILWRYAKMKGEPTDTAADTSLADFVDADAVGDFAVEAISWAVEQGIIEGTNKGLEPKLGSSRAQIAAVISRYLSR